MAREPHKTLEDSKVLANVLSEKFCYAVKDMKTGHVIRGRMSLTSKKFPSKRFLKELYCKQKLAIDWSSLLGTRICT